MNLSSALLKPFRRNVSVPQVDEGIDWKAFHTQNEMTPDMWKIDQFHRQNIFLFDDLQSGGRYNEEFIRPFSHGMKPENPVCYTHADFTMWMKDLGEQFSYPIVLPGSYRPTGFVRYPVEPAKIRGELWSISPKALKELDILRERGKVYARQRIKVIYPWRDVRFGKIKPLPVISPHSFTTTTAWIYIGVENYWDAQIGGIFGNSQMNTFEHDTPRPYVNKYFKFEPQPDPAF